MKLPRVEFQGETSGAKWALGGDSGFGGDVCFFFCAFVILFILCFVFLACVSLCVLVCLVLVVWVCFRF